MIRLKLALSELHSFVIFESRKHSNYEA